MNQCRNIPKQHDNIVFLYYNKIEVIKMNLTFDFLLPKLAEYEIEVFQNSQTSLLYNEVRFLEEEEMSLKKNILYLGNTSMIGKDAGTFKGFGLILIKDSDFNPLELEAEVLLLPKETNLSKLFNNVLDVFHSKRKLVDSSAALLNSLIEGKGLNYIVEVGSEILGNPVLLVDATSKLLASSSSSSLDDNFWNELIAIGYGKDKTNNPYVQKGFVDKIRQMPDPIMFDPGSLHDLKRIVGKIEINNKIVGFIGVLENDQKLKEEDINIVRLLCDVIASEMQKSKLYENFTGVTHEFLLIDLLDERINNSTLDKKRSDDLFPVANKNLFVVSVNIPENNSNSHYIGYIRWSLESLLPSCKSVYYNEHIVLIINVKHKEQWHKIESSLIDILRKNKLDGGLSLMFHDILDIKKHYIQAKSASNIGKYFKKTKTLFDYDDLYVHDLLMNLKESKNVKDFCHPSIFKIQDYDKSNGTDYYKTLYQYLLCAGNITKTADIMFLHRNTVVHRITKLEEITSMSLNDGNNRFKLLLSYRILQLTF